MVSKLNIFNYKLIDLCSKFESLNLKKFNANQVFDWIYKKNITDFKLIKNINSESIKKIDDTFELYTLKKIDVYTDKKDLTEKFIFQTYDNHFIESVLMRFNYGNSICISTQIGCNMGCKFCASGLIKKIRNLETSEIIQQIMIIKAELEKKNLTLSNIVVMGIGEPFDNYDNLSNALKIITEHIGINIGSRHITVSTSGMIEKIIQFGHDFPQINLAISLHAPNDEIRNKIMPINQVYNMEKLFNALFKYSKLVNRKITFEYLLLKNINDSEENALELAQKIKKLECFVNIINYNNINESKFSRSENSHKFAKILMDNNIKVTTRLERGNEINAACGQLRAKYENGI